MATLSAAFTVSSATPDRGLKYRSSSPVCNATTAAFTSETGTYFSVGQIGLFAIIIVASLEFNIFVFLPVGNYIRAGGNDALGSLSVVVAILFHGSLGAHAAIL